MATVSEILARKGTTVVSMEAAESVVSAARLMNERKIGCLVITDGGEMVGIFTERDALRRLIAEPRDPAHTSLREVMTSPVTTCRSQTSLEECVGVITQEGIRHLPIVDDGNLRGIITSRDLLAFQVEEQEATIRYLHSYTFEVGGEGG